MLRIPVLVREHQFVSDPYGLSNIELCRYPLPLHRNFFLARVIASPLLGIGADAFYVA